MGVVSRLLVRLQQVVSVIIGDLAREALSVLMAPLGDLCFRGVQNILGWT
jgi:hypothetical protein